MKLLRNALLACLIAAGTRAAADFHIMNVNEVLTGSRSNTAVQYVELEMEAFGQNNLINHHLVSRNGAGTIIADYLVPSTVPNGALGNKVLFATQAFADLHLVTPDFILPANFLSPNAGQVSFVGTATTRGTVSWGAYAGPGINGAAIALNNNTDIKSLTRTGTSGSDKADFQSLDNTPTNNAGQSGHLPPSAAADDWLLYE